LSKEALIVAILSRTNLRMVCGGLTTFFLDCCSKAAASAAAWASENTTCFLDCGFLSVVVVVFVFWVWVFGVSMILCL
jgi:hypothetical protein